MQANDSPAGGCCRFLAEPGGLVKAVMAQRPHFCSRPGCFARHSTHTG